MCLCGGGDSSTQSRSSISVPVPDVPSMFTHFKIGLCVFKFQVELQNVTKKAGYDTRLIAMETLSLREQALQIMCSKVLIGVQGMLLDIRTKSLVSAKNSVKIRGSSKL